MPLLQLKISKFYPVLRARMSYATALMSEAATAQLYRCEYARPALFTIKRRDTSLRSVFHVTPLPT